MTARSRAITSTLSGGTGLASNATFKSLVGQAPSGAQTLTFVSISALVNIFGIVAAVCECEPDRDAFGQPVPADGAADLVGQR